MFDEELEEFATGIVATSLQIILFIPIFLIILVVSTISLVSLLFE